MIGVYVFANDAHLALWVRNGRHADSAGALSAHGSNPRQEYRAGDGCSQLGSFVGPSV